MEVHGTGWYLGYVAVYFLAMFGIGFYYFLKVKTADDYLIGGWNMGFWPIVGTVISTWCGASVFIGAPWAWASRWGFRAICVSARPR